MKFIYAQWEMLFCCKRRQHIVYVICWPFVVLFLHFLSVNVCKIDSLADNWLKAFALLEPHPLRRPLRPALNVTMTGE